MIRQVTAIYEDGVLKPLSPLDLKEQDVVTLSIERTEAGTAAAEAPGLTLFDVLNEAGLIGCIKDGPPDLSTNPKYMEGFGKSGD